MLNIMIVKEKAAPSESNGTWRVVNDERSRRLAVYQIGSIAAFAAMEVIGLMAESGICILSVPRRDTIIKIVA
jgi:hypothetical protein